MKTILQVLIEMKIVKVRRALFHFECQTGKASCASKIVPDSSLIRDYLFASFISSNADATLGQAEWRPLILSLLTEHRDAF